MEKVTLSGRIREFLFGMFGYEASQQALEFRSSLETMFLLVTFGELVGVPILPPYYGLRLLPYVAPRLRPWKRRVLRERELSDAHEHHLHGL